MNSLFPLVSCSYYLQVRGAVSSKDPDQMTFVLIMQESKGNFVHFFNGVGRLLNLELHAQV